MIAKVVENTSMEKVVELFYNDVWVDFTDDLVLDSIGLNDVDKKELEKNSKDLLINLLEQDIELNKTLI